ncbi:MAG: histidine--tRNA ligase [Nanoarchaeota archaeon]
MTFMTLQPAKGVRDLPPEEKALKNKVVETLRKVFEIYGFAPLETPILQRYETLAAKFAAGEASDALKETFKLQDQGGRELGLRFDLTVPLAAYIAMNPTLKLPFKRYEIGQVFRDGPIKTGRYREFWQCDVDIVGSDSLLADAEVLAVIDTAFKKLGLDIVIKVNNRKILNGILEQAGIGIQEKESAIIAIDKLDKIGKDGVSKELQERGYSAKQIEGIFALIKENMSLAELKKKLTSKEGIEGLVQLEELFSYLTAMNVRSVVYDVSLARGLAYYTGAVFEAYLKKGKITSSVAAGGRWDNMIGNYIGGNRMVPAVGVAFGLEPIMDTLRLERKVPAQPPAQVYVLPIDMSKTSQESLAIVQQLREQGISTAVSLGKKGVSKNLEYANALRIPYVVIVGEDELRKNKVKLRDMQTGEEQLLTVKEVGKKLK